MSKTIFAVTAQRDNVEWKISLATMGNELLAIGTFGTLVFKAHSLDETYQVDFSFDADNNKINVSIIHPPLLSVSCFIRCALDLVGPILDCYKKNRKNWKGFLDCLEGQGHALGTAALACAWDCLE